MAGLKGSRHMNASKHGLTAIQKRREESITTEHEERIRQYILDGLVADKGGDGRYRWSRANTTVKFGLLLINPFFAQLYSMLLGLLFSFEQLALDSLNLDHRSGPAPLINNTN